MPVLATIGALFSVAYSFRLICAHIPWPGARRLPPNPHDPGFGLWAAPAFLAALVVLIGVMPMTIVGWLVDTSTSAVTGEAIEAKISHWHGFVPALWMSMIAVGGGLILLGLHAPV